MNNKYLAVLIICALGLMLCVGAVSAKSMKTKNFADFKVDVPKDSNFVKQKVDDESKDSDIPMSMEVYVDEKNIVGLYYIDSLLFAGENNAVIYHGIFSSLNPDINQSYESQENNLRIIEPVPKSDISLSLVGLTSGNKTIILFGEDVSLLKEMGRSVKFK